MKNFTLKGQRGESKIILNTPLSELKNYCKNRKTIIITDENVNRFYGHLFKGFKIIKIGTGEKIKTLDTIKDIYENFLDSEMDRHSFIIGAGGGIVCDIAGFAASTFMRGVPFAFAPTTLLAQVDASIGGKNGVNFKGYKNIVGTFNQPEFILYDFNVLKSLPGKEILCGLGEIIKHGAIKSLSYFEYLEKNADNIMALETDVIEKVVSESIKIKIQVVEEDELERGERKKLNFGHTFGHAIEKTTGLSHGEAISAGMIIANRYAVKKGLLKEKDSVRLENLMKKFNIPVDLDMNKELIYEAIKKDKKKNLECIDFIVLEEIGKAKILPVKLKEFLNII